MPTRNTDSSYLTQRKQAKALYAFSVQNKAAVNAGTSVVRGQLSYSMGDGLADIIVQQAQGGCFCANDVSNNVFNFQSPGPCCGGS